MKKFAQTSLVDYILNLRPDLHPNYQNNGVNASAAKILYKTWKNSQKLSDKLIIRPNLSESEISQLESDKLIERSGPDLKITSKGSSVIKVMVLGDESSAFDKNGKQVDYKTALDKTKVRKKGQSQEDVFWSRFKL